MSWWTDLRLRFYRAALRQRLRARRVTPQSMPYARARRVGLLFDATEPADRTAVLGYADGLRRAGKEVHLLGLLREQPGQPDLGFPNFGTRDLDWRYLPKTDTVPAFLAQPLDLLLNLDPDHHRALTYVAALTSAPFRVGATTADPTHYELMIDAPDGDLDRFVRQAEHYLQRMHTPHAPIA